MQTIRVVKGDITKLEVDAIVNAANERMLGGGGVDGAIHRAAGRELYKACYAFPEIKSGVRCPTGSCQLTPGFKLPAKYVIHTVGPIWDGGDNDEEELLRSCYRSALELALERGFSSIAFPAIGCGGYGYPPEEAVPISISEIRAVLDSVDRPIEVTLVAFSDELFEAMQAELDAQS
jgi:O-acetyl-ADP-ribose deacetylase (regulator of RNase III)